MAKDKKFDAGDIYVNIDVPTGTKKRPSIVGMIPYLHRHTIEYHDGSRHKVAAETHLKELYEDTHHFVVEKHKPTSEWRQGMLIWSLTWIIVIEPNYAPDRKVTVH